MEGVAMEWCEFEVVGCKTVWVIGDTIGIRSVNDSTWFIHEDGVMSLTDPAENAIAGPFDSLEVAKVAYLMLRSNYIRSE